MASIKNNFTENLVWAKKILSKLPGNYSGESVEPFLLNGEVIERPHIIRALEIIKQKENGK